MLNILRMAAMTGVLALALPASAQPDPSAAYPNHPVRIIVSAPPGGADTMILTARLG